MSEKQTPQRNETTPEPVPCGREVSKKKVTIRDVAALAGVSIATVSRVLNNSPKVEFNTRKTVTQVIKETGFRAKGGGPDNTFIGIMLRRHSKKEAFLNRYTSEVINGLVDYAVENGLSTHILPYQESDFAHPEDVVDLLAGKNIHGACFLNPLNDDRMVSALNDVGYPNITIGARYDHPDASYIVIDNEQGIHSAVKHLADLGHTSIGYVSTRSAGYARARRLETFQDAIGKHGLPHDPDFIVNLTIGEGSVNDTVIDWFLNSCEIRRLPTAFMCLNDTIAMTVIYALQKQGIRVPEDISIVGFDDYAESKFFTPALTTIINPMYNSGYLAASVLHKGINNNPETVHKVFSSKLIIRESTAPPAAH